MRVLLLTLVPLVAGSLASQYRPAAARSLASRGKMPLSMRANRFVARSSEEASAPAQKPVEGVDSTAKPADLAAAASADSTPAAPSAPAWSLRKGTPPMGNYFDPLGFSKGKSVSELKRLREAELVHGRVGMLAILGMLQQESMLEKPLFYVPGDDLIVSGPSITHFQQIAERFPNFWLVLTGIISIVENLRARKGWENPTAGKGLFQLKDDYEPGDLGFDPLGAFPVDQASRDWYKDGELNNGRLGMLAAAGLVAQELVDGKTIWEHYGAMMPPHGPV